MIVVGVVLIVAGAVFGVDVAMKNRFTVGDIEVFGSTLGLHHAEQIFLLGVITGAVILLGLALLVGGTVRRRTKNVAHRRHSRRDVETDRRAADLNARNQNVSPAVAERTSRDHADGASAAASREGGAQDPRVSHGSGGSTALDRDALKGSRN